MHFDFRTNAEKLFTNVFHTYRKSTKRFVMMKGGASASKSYSAHQRELIELLTAEKDTLFIRKFASDIENSCYKLLKELATDWGIYHEFRWRYSGANRDITCNATGRQITFRGLDDPAKVKSIVGIKRIIIEEAEQITEADFLELNRRVRGIEGIQIVFIFNPITRTHWIHQFFYNEDHKFVKKYSLWRQHTEYLHFTYRDNIKNITQQDIDFLEGLRDISISQWEVYANGNWGSLEAERPFMYNFDHDKHVKTCEINPKLPLYLSFDFNVDPATCLVRQGARDWVHYLDEIRLKDSDAWKMAEVVMSKYEGYHFLITGDATGRMRRFESRKNESAWKIIQRLLRVPNGQMRVPKENPFVENSRMDCNIMLARFPDLRISPRCVYLIDDMQSVETKEDGSIDKTKNAHKSHLLDCFRYDINTWFRWFTKRHNIRDRKKIAA